MVHIKESALEGLLLHTSEHCGLTLGFRRMRIVSNRRVCQFEDRGGVFERFLDSY